MKATSGKLRERVVFFPPTSNEHVSLLEYFVPKLKVLFTLGKNGYGWKVTDAQEGLQTCLEAFIYRSTEL